MLKSYFTFIRRIIIFTVFIKNEIKMKLNCKIISALHFQPKAFLYDFVDYNR